MVDDQPLVAFAAAVGPSGPVAAEGGRTRWTLGGPPADDVRLVRAPSGIVEYRPEEMTVRVRAGTLVDELAAALADSGQRCALPERRGTVGGAVAVGEHHVELLGRGTLRASVLEVRYVSSDGVLVRGGGPTVKNVTGFDLPRLLTGSLGTIGLIAEVVLRTNPVPDERHWVACRGVDPFEVRDLLLRPGAILWDGTTTTVLLEGYGPDVDADAVRLSSLGDVTDASGPPELPRHRWSLAPGELRSVAAQVGSFVASIGAGIVWADVAQPPRGVDAGAALVAARVKDNFDPTGRLNPGRDPAAR